MQNGVKCQQSDEELRDLYKQEHVAPFKQGRDLLNCARFNKTLSFSPQERHHYRIHGLYPAAVLPLEVQAKREIAQIREQTSDLAKYIWLDNLQERDEKLFYKVVVDHVDELLPIVYTPT
ncbi:malic enzyme, partial [Aphelenchoides avenae]